MLNFREEELLKIFYENPKFLPQFNKALDTLHDLGVIEFLKERGKVQLIKKDIDLGVEAARSHGFNEAIDTLVFLKQILGSVFITKDTKPPDFGGFEAAIRTDNLTKEEVDAIRSGTTPKYETSSSFPNPRNGSINK